MIGQIVRKVNINFKIQSYVPCSHIFSFEKNRLKYVTLHFRLSSQIFRTVVLNFLLSEKIQWVSTEHLNLIPFVKDE